jgi:hypothetical protein
LGAAPAAPKSSLPDELPITIGTIAIGKGGEEGKAELGKFV